ncbi:nucleoside-diphosphate-sugar epimerase [Clavibacter michiganensis]|uniref:NAD-dependent epimerase/dehydratase family protein n=1 Tax=Clavibacter michiganensis TaxID=28447 RepID=UPI00195EFE68|nr:NAD(P)-dependent oxidoreductase [Clavibacter michiganensis]MBM7389384.1 nucleoside-diphosphate-sugar epimerase [Clavibacter michiganensis]MBP2457313.1 nucleoside-diphosphate-sugar epimerase [Clavibacter michiganensis]MDQ0409883.1 nucleoside-diphosphate-sugar epimerase [Clavibacter michiganensis]
MKVLVTGSRGKVGRAAVEALVAAGHDVTGVDLVRPVFDAGVVVPGRYVMADLTDQGDAFAVVAGMDAVVHVAAIPQPTGNPAHVVLQTNLMSTFHLIEAAVRFGVPRFVNISSESIVGNFFPERPFLPDYAPVDEEHPLHPQDPYALSKAFGEQLMDAAVRRSDIRVISLRPSTVHNDDNYASNLGKQVRDASVLTANLWSYIDADDLADAIVLSVASDLPGHEVFYIAAADNAGGHDFAAELERHYGDAIELRAIERVDSSGISTAKARRLLGWEPKRSWRDHLDADGNALPR